MRVLKILFLLSLCAVNCLNDRGKRGKLVYYRDLSEHCRRRVTPSAFLAKHVVEANARIFHFSRLEIPYSCFIAIRTESGGNLIMVLQLVEDEHKLSDVCEQFGEQMVVYELGETFGGYWGPIPESLYTANETTPQAVYTIKSTYPIPPTIEEITDTETPEPPTTRNDTARQTDDEDSDSIVVEVPLVQVSGQLLGPYKGVVTDDVLDPDQNFDLIYDVMPRADEKYDTSAFPIVNISVMADSDTAKPGDQTDRYQLDFQIDNRYLANNWYLTPGGNIINDASRTIAERKYYPPRRRFPMFKPSKRPHLGLKTTRKLGTILKNRHRYSQPVLDPDYFLVETTTKKILPPSSKSWDVVLDLVKNIGENVHRRMNTATTTEMRKSDKVLINKLSNMKHNSSDYLQPKLESYAKHKVEHLLPINDKYSTQFLDPFLLTPFGFKPSISTISEFSDTNLFLNIPPIFKSHSLINSEPEIHKSNISELMKFVHYNESLALERPDEVLFTFKNILQERGREPIPFTKSSFDVETRDKVETQTNKVKKELTNYESQNTKASSHEITIATSQNPSTVSMVDHESWENIVQAAPEMALVLNQTNSGPNFKSKSGDVSQGKRSKRHIQVVEVENARPHTVTATRNFSTTTEPPLQASDMQEFAELVEMEDDEMQSRMHLRYLRRYVGPSILNICNQSNDTKSRHVFLFNSSRIVIAISNFTLPSMTLILTAASLVSSTGRCPKTNFECQITGTRVCIDDNSACDDVPNCGANDLFDEDRLLCGALDWGRGQRVYLAACICAAVLLGVMCSLHYWLVRCVPAVADAFFLYTDSSHNVLNLATVMRSPRDNDTGTVDMFHTNFFECDTEYIERYKKKKGCFACLKWFFTLEMLRSKVTKRKDSESFELPHADRSRYSFTELELNKIAQTTKVITDASVQTGDSLLMPKNEGENYRAKRNIQEKEQQGDDNNSNKEPVKMLEFVMMMEPMVKQYENELNTIKAMRGSRMDIKRSGQQVGMVPSQKPKLNDTLIRNQVTATTEEQEIQTTFYDPAFVENNAPSTSRDSEPEKLREISVSNISREMDPALLGSRKRLRFDDGIATIDEMGNAIEGNNGQTTTLSGPTTDLGVIEEERFHISNFFNKNKNKSSKSKKKWQQK